MTTPTRPASDLGALATEVIDAVNALAGAHDGERALHSKGTLCAGSFTASSEAANLSTAGHLQGGDPVRAHVRFSNGGGEPEGPTARREARGMAVKLYLGDGTTTDIVCVTTPVFLVRTPEDFLELTQARKPDPQTGPAGHGAAGRVARRASRGEAGGPAHARATRRRPATAVRLQRAPRVPRQNAAGEQRYIRYRWEPEAGEANVAEEDEPSLAHDYLQEDLRERLAQSPAGFTLTRRRCGRRPDRRLRRPDGPTIASGSRSAAWR